MKGSQLWTAGLVTAAVFAGGCSSAPTTCSVPLELAPPRLAVPLPGATSVSRGIATLILSGDVVPISLVVPDAPASTPIATSATALPSPLPSPIGSPEVANAPYYAVSVPALAGSTTYAVDAALVRYGCDGTPTTTQNVNVGQFTTQAGLASTLTVRR